MSTHERKERDRARRHRLIVDAARALAEAEGWDAVTTRRLAERVEYSQPVLYSHFAGKDAIVAAVAVDGFAELAGELAAARAADPATALHAVATAYLDFAAAKPALYEAMFLRRTELPFGGPDTPAPLLAGFAEIRAAVAPFAGDRDQETLTEVVWSTLHGLATLDGSARLRPGHRAARLALLPRLLEP